MGYEHFESFVLFSYCGLLFSNIACRDFKLKSLLIKTENVIYVDTFE